MTHNARPLLSIPDTSESSNPSFNFKKQDEGTTFAERIFKACGVSVSDSRMISACQ